MNEGQKASNVLWQYWKTKNG